MADEPIFADIEEELEREVSNLDEAKRMIPTVDFIVRKCGECDREIAAIKSWMDEMLAKIKTIQERRLYLEGKVFLTAANLTKSLGKKTITVPSGKVVVTHHSASVEVEDAELVKAAGYVRMPPPPKPAVDKVAVNKHFTETGELPDGCALVPERDSVKVTPKAL